MKKYSLLIVMFTAIFLSACDEFLSEPPSKTSSLVPSTTEHLENLLNSYSSFSSEPNKDVILGSDDYGLLTDLFDNSNAIYNVTTAHYATWDVNYLPDDDRPYFPSEWKKIFNANLILENLGKVSGSEEEKASLKAEAHFIRAYSYFQMVNTYCLPYSQENMSELGLPVKASTSFEESGARVSLKETWDLILSDLEQALELDRDLKLKDGKYRSWRASTPAINAFAARAYLTMNDYTKAQAYAEAALADHNAMMDYNTDMRYSDIVSEETIDGELKRIWYPYTHDAQSDQTDRMEWKELYYYRFLTYGSWFYIPSPDLLDLYDHDYDLRYKYHIVEDYSYDRGMSISYPGYIFFHKDQIPSGPTVGEMLLVKAECQARTGKWNEALTTVNQLREKRMDNTASADVINLAASSQAEALTKILEERRRELPFTQRFFDVRRYNNNEDPADDVLMTRTFYPIGSSAIEGSQAPITYQLDKKSRKFARPLPNTDINTTEGVLEQNTY
ncbi:RagB/SusD family nutrient uptake outer membrane protein [Marinifilum fragile]|uniref:RagB/SusD family nutrient uptake outer membrane protein n=1 Tax=Marinifilum fragile TaxID=570161 RepID=UPI002AAB4A36|nr:RagB/SusD family nutrient uptake outer membrane protein [Marinifilum fragile]